MTTGEETETCRGQQKAGNRVPRGQGGQMRPGPSFSTLSTFAIQAGQSQIVLSVLKLLPLSALKSGSLVHLQLVQVHPGLCEIGSNQEENHTLIQEQQQLLEKLKKHEHEVLSVVEKKRVRRDGGRQEEEVSKAMTASLTEGWLLLLHLLHRRQEVLTLAAHFYRQALEFSVGINRLEDLQIKPEDDRLTEVNFIYDSMRRDLLEKSLQVLTSSSILLQKLKQLQRTEALQRRGGVLQEQEEEEQEESSWCSRGMVLRLEEQVEALQDRRRRADQTVRLQLQQAQSGIMVPPNEEAERGRAGSETSQLSAQQVQDWTLTVNEILESGSTSPDLHPETGTDLKTDSRSEETIKLQSGFRSDVGPCSGVDLKPGSESETLTHPSGLDLSESRSEMTKRMWLGSRLDPKPDSPLDNIDLQSRSRTKEVQPDSRSSSDIHYESRLERSKDLEPDSEEPEDSHCVSRSLMTSRSRSGVRPGSLSGSDLKFESRTETRNLQARSRLQKDLQRGSTSDQPRSDLNQIFLSSTSRSETKKTSTKEVQLQSALDLQPRSGSDIKPESRSLLRLSSSLDVQSAPGSNLKPECSSEETTSLQPGSKREDSRPETKEMHTVKLDLDPDSRSEEAKGAQSLSGSYLKPRSRSNMDPAPGSDVNLQSEPLTEESKDPGTTTDVPQEYRSDIKPESRPEEKRDLQSGSRILLSVCGSQRKYLQTQYKSNMEPHSRSALTKDQSNTRSVLSPRPSPDVQSGSGVESESRSETVSVESGSVTKEIKDLKPGSKSDQTRQVQQECITEQTWSVHTGTVLKPESGSDMSRNLMPGSDKTKHLELQSRTEMKPDMVSEPRSVRTSPDAQSASGTESSSEETRNLQPASESDETRMMHTESRSEAKEMLKAASEGQSSSTGSERSKDLQPGFRSDLQSGSRAGENKDLQPGSGAVLNARSASEAKTGSEPEISDLKLESGSVQNRDLQSGSGSEDEDVSLSEVSSKQPPAAVSGQPTELQSMLGKDSQSVEDPAHCTPLTNQKQSLLMSFEHLMEKLCSWLQRCSSLLSDSSEAGRQLFDVEDILKTHLQLHTQAQAVGRDAEDLQQVLEQLRSLCDVSSRQLSRVDQVLKELQSLNRTIETNLQLLQPYVCFLRSAEQVEAEMGELRDIYRRPQDEEEEEDEAGSTDTSRSPEKDEVEACWQETLQRLLTAQEQGNHYVHTVTMVLGSGLNLHSMVSVVQQKVEQLHQAKQEVDELRSQKQQQKKKSCRKDEARLQKTLQDLKCVSDLLDSCTRVDLGSDLQTSRLLQHFSQAAPHFTQLDAEAESVMRSRESLQGVQDGREEEKTTDLSELLRCQQEVKHKIQQSKSILNMTSSFHRSAGQLEALLHSEPTAPSTGASQLQIQNLFETTSALQTNICAAVTHSGWAGFQVEQLEARLLSLDSLRISWLKEAALKEEKRQLTRLLHDDITQLRDSFKELKKRFSNLKFNYLKRNDRTRNMKAVRNQLQQVELYEEKRQVLRQRVQGVMARLGSEVKDGGVAREMEDTANELQRQMGELERHIREHRKTLDMTCRLQQAMEEYQFWCEEASATIARVGKFSSECRSTEAVSVLYRQFEKFVWPTVPQQEERIHQITELAIRVHGVEEGRRCIERTVSKHSDMVESIRELSDALMELEAKLKLESLKENMEEKEVKEVDETERRRGRETEEEEDMKMKEQRDNRSPCEAADMRELKETGHTPELTTEHDGKEVPVKRQTAANRKPPLQRSHSQEADRPAESRRHSERVSSSYCSTHTFSLSCSVVEANRRVHTICSRTPPAGTEHQATPPPAVIGPSLSDTQCEFQGREKGQQEVSASCDPQDASAGRLLEAERQQEDAMTDDSLSNDEYECASPDDISLPPLAETPESNMIQSDVEDGFCFSTHTHQGLAEPAGTSTATVHRQRQSSQSESCPTCPTSCHSSTRSVPTAPPVVCLYSIHCSGSDPVQESKTPHSEVHCVPDQDSPPSTVSTPHCPSLPVDTDCSLPQEKTHPQDSSPDSRPGPDQDSPSSQTRKEESSSSTSQNSSVATASPVTQQTVPSQSLTSGSPSSTLRSDPGDRGTENHPEPNSVSTHRSTITSSTLSSERTYQAVYTFHESLTPTRIQGCMHDPGMTPSSRTSAAPLHPEAQNQALAQQANPHVTPPSSPPHLLTPDQDPDICVPMAIREEIRLTPQIQGPASPAPSPPQAECLPQEKASRPGPPCFTRPLSRATVMGGSPVTLEVEVTGHPEPTLIWFEDEELSSRGSGPALPCGEGGCFLSDPEPPDSDGGLKEARAAAGGSDRWLVEEVLDIISVETWFGTLCVLLWLLYLVLL